MSNDKRLENLKPFKKGQSGNPSGSPKRKSIKIINNELQEKGFEKVTPLQIIENVKFCLNLTIEEMERAMEDEDNPYLFRAVCKELLGEKSNDWLDKLINRICGSPKQQIEQHQTNIDLSNLSTEEIKALLKDE
jgi:hypothetical protein